MRTENSTTTCHADGKSLRFPKPKPRQRHQRRLGLAATLVLPLAVAACGPETPADPLAAQGQEIFARCAACHAADRPLTKVGPHLVGIFGRTAGTLEGFPYSDALTESGLVWDDATLAAFLHNPRDLVPGNRMAFVGLRDDADIEAVIAYLRAVSGPTD